MARDQVDICQGDHIVEKMEGGGENSFTWQSN
jgi:hypothetical protein